MNADLAHLRSIHGITELHHGIRILSEIVYEMIDRLPEKDRSELVKILQQRLGA
jgi:hypothetical protein